jgi:elongation factor P
MQVSTAEFKKGLRIVFDGNPYTIVDFQHVKPGKGGAFVRTKLKHMKLGKVIDNTFRSGEKVALVDFEEKHMQFLYRDDRYHLMDTETYEQVSLSANEVGDAREYLRENTEVDVLYIAGSPVAVELPNFVELAIARTDPGVRGDTAQGGTKPATLETGAVVQVPLFLGEGDIVKVDTRTGEYLGRVAVAGA